MSGDLGCQEDVDGDPLEGRFASLERIAEPNRAQPSFNARDRTKRPCPATPQPNSGPRHLTTGPHRIAESQGFLESGGRRWRCREVRAFKVLWRFCSNDPFAQSSLHIKGTVRKRAVREVMGDVLIHGPSLVARPVGSEWRNRRPCVYIESSTMGAEK